MDMIGVVEVKEAEDVNGTKKDMAKEDKQWQ
jgi:hypothetical protein